MTPGGQAIKWVGGLAFRYPFPSVKAHGSTVGEKG